MDTDRKKPEITTAILLETRVTNKDGNHPVKLRITFHRRRKYYSLKGEHLTKDEFRRIFGERPRDTYKAKRKKYEAVENRAINIIDNVITDFSFDVFETEYLNYKNSHSTSIESYFEEKASELDEFNKIQTATLYRSTLKSLLNYDENVTFTKITPQYLKKYEKWMLNEGNTYTTIGIYLRNFKHIINRAIKDNVISVYPFGQGKDKYTIPAGKNTKKALTINDIEKLFKHQSDNKNEYLALQYWLFSYLCNGMNMVDIANLRYKNIEENNLKFIRQKTKDTSKEVPIINVLLLQQSHDIISSIGNEDKTQENYIFPIYEPKLTEIEKLNKLKQHIKLTNKYIRRVAKKIGINENITTYWARHSYSTILKRSGAPIEFISEQLGHQSIRVTQNYLDTFEDEQIEKYTKSLLSFKRIG